MTTTPDSASKAILLVKLDHEWSRLEELLAQLSPAEMEQPGVDHEWSVKDILAHLAAWDRRGMGWIAAAVGGETPAIPEVGKTWGDADALNEATYQANRERPVGEALADFRQAHRCLVAQIEALSEEDIRKRIRGHGKGGPAVVATLIKWRYRHLRAHRKPIAAFVKATQAGKAAPPPQSLISDLQSLTVTPAAPAPPTPMRPQSPISDPQSPTPKSAASYTAVTRIADMHADERPRERLLAYGASALSSAELLGILLRVGIHGENAVMMGQRLLSAFGGLPGLSRASAQELGALKGLGEAKACQLLAALELGKRLAAASPSDRPVVTSPADAANLVSLEMSLLDHEQLRVMLLDTKNRVYLIQTVYKGTVNTSQVRVAEIFKEAIRQNYPAIIVVHNHPSGDPTPSRDDVRVTRDIVAAGELLGVNVLDHLIIGQQAFVSMKERGLGF